MLNFVSLVAKDKKSTETFSFLKLPVSQRKIMNKSVEMFAEPYPCIIQKTACINSLNLELQKVISKKYKEDVLYELSDILEIATHIPDEYRKNNYYVKFNKAV